LKFYNAKNNVYIISVVLKKLEYIMSKTKKTFICLAFTSMLWVLVTCSSDSSPSSSKKIDVILYCNQLQTSVVKGGTIAKPKLICDNGRTATDITWNGLPEDDVWKVDPNTYAPDFVISVNAFCGTIELWEVPCGTVEVIEASSSSRAGGSSSSVAGGSSSSVVGGSSSSRAGGSSSSVGGGSSSSVGGDSNSGSVLTCIGLQENVARGGTIAIPTLECTNDAPPTNISWTGRPSGATATSWPVRADTQSELYNIGVTATCGAAGVQSGVRCGTVTVGTGSNSSSSTGGNSSSSANGNSSSSVADTASSSSVADTASSSSVADTASSSSVADTASSSSVADTASSSSVTDVASSSSADESSSSSN